MTKNESSSQAAKKRIPIGPCLSRVVGALLICGTIYLAVKTREWVLLVLVPYGVYFLIGGHRFFYK
jgi:hypothetical protein